MMLGLDWGLLFSLIVLLPMWRIFRRAGFHPALSLIVLIPGLGWLASVAILSFADWPAVTGRPWPPGRA